MRNPITNAVTDRAALQLDVPCETVRRRLYEAGMHLRTTAVNGILKESGCSFGVEASSKIKLTFLSTNYNRLHC